jgi:hypothetical protein
MIKTSTKHRVRRSDEQLIAGLLAKIAEIKRRAELRTAKRDPAIRRISAALRSIDKAGRESKDPATKVALEEARAILAAAIAPTRAAPAGEIVPVPHQHRIELDRLLERAEQISAALGLESGAMRPVMRELIDGGQVRTKGQKRATSYHPA